MCLQPDWGAALDGGYQNPRSILIAGVPPTLDIRSFCRLCADPAARRVRAPRRRASARRRGSDASRDDGGGGDGDGPPPLGDFHSARPDSGRAVP
jgi:hypothetical protein